MKIVELEVEGFRGFKGKVKIPFGPGFTVITGRNGSGKTSICDALELAISGQISRYQADVEAGERMSDYTWWRNGKGVPSPKVELTVEREDGTLGFCTAAQTEHKTNFPPQEFFESFHPDVPLTRLCQTAIVRDETIVRLSTDLPEAERFDLFYKTVGVGDLTRTERRSVWLSERIREQMRRADIEYRAKRDRVAEGITRLSEAQVLASKAAGIESQTIKSQMAAILGLSDEVSITMLPVPMRRTLSELRVRSRRLQQLQTSLGQSENIRDRGKRLEEDLSKTNLRLTESEAALLQATDALANSEQKLASIRIIRTFLADLAQIREIGSRIGLLSGHCPLCNSDISAESFQTHLNEIAKTVSAQDQELEGMSFDVSRNSAAYSRLRDERESILLEQTRLSADAHAIRKTISELNAEISALGLEPNLESVMTELGAVSNKEKALQDGLSLVESYLEQSHISDIERQKQLAESEAEILAKRSEQLELLAGNAKIATDTIKRVSWEAVDDCMSALSPLLSELYFRLRPHADYAQIKYRMRGDVKRFLSFMVGDDINPRFIFSSGQRRALGLSFLLAVFLSRPWCKLKTLILDDPVQHIDDYRALHFAEVLSSIRQLGYQVICFVEDSDLAELLCRRLRSESVGEGLKIELEYVSGEGATVKRVTPAPLLPQRLLLTA